MDDFKNEAQKQERWTENDGQSSSIQLPEAMYSCLLFGPMAQ